MLEAKIVGPATSPATLPHSRHLANQASTSKYPSSSPTPLRRHVHINGAGVEEELAFYDASVIWSKGAELYRRWTFDGNEETVTWAGFVWFPAQGSSSSSSALSTDLTVTPRDATFGPFHTSRHAAWSRPPTSPTSTTPRLVRTVLICLKSRAIAYYPSGDSHTIHLPFIVDNAYPLPRPTGGVVLQRRLEKREIRRFNGSSRNMLRGMNGGNVSVLDDIDRLDDGDSLPRIYTLSNTFEELKAVVEADVENGKIHSEMDLDASYSLLHVADDPYGFVIAYDRTSREVVFYMRHNVPIQDTKPEPLRHLRPHELLAQPPTSTLTAGRPSLHRTASTFSTGGDRRVSSLTAEAMDRTRRGPRVSRGGVVEPQHHLPTGELQAVLDPPSLPSVVSAPTTSRLRAKGKGRVSLASEPDRRASGGSSMLMNARPALFNAGERDLKETTMMMGLEREESSERSELVLERIWVWKPPSAVDESSLQVFLSENLTSDLVHINIHTSSTLYIFPAQRTTQWTISPPLSVACSTALPILSTRHDVLDTVILQDGDLHLITSAKHTIPLTLGATDGKDELPRQLASSLTMVLDTDDPMEERRARKVVSISTPVRGRFSATMEDGEEVRLSIDFRIKDSLVRRCFEAFACLLPPDETFELKRLLLAELQTATSPWQSFVRVLTTFMGIPTITIDDTSRDPTIRRLAALLAKRKARPNPQAPSPLRGNAAVAALLALHLVGQDCRLAQSRRDDLKRVAGLINHLTACIGRSDWQDYWRRLMPLPSPPTPAHNAADSLLLDQYPEPPDIIAYLSRRLVTPLKPFPNVHSIQPHISELGLTRPCESTQIIVAIYDKLGVSSDPTALTARRRAGDMVTFMVERKLGHEYVVDLPAGIAMPIMEMIRVCQADPGQGWSAEVYDFIGRSDLAAQARGGEMQSRDRDKMLDDVTPTIAAIMASVHGPTQHAHNMPALPHVRFGSDRRLAEVERIMQTTRTRTVMVPEPKGASDADTASYQQSMVNTIALRTLSILVGQGMFEYGTRRASITNTFDVPLIELTVKVVPGNITLSAQIAADNADWPCFHNGVSTALSISPDCQNIDSSWIVFNRPANLNPEHGGFLLGLGLTGHLRHLATYHAFPYMEPRHDFTSVGLLLGLAASFAGSQDLLVTKVLSLHTHALLPLGSVELNASAIVQSTSLVGLGLVYAGSRNLRMAEVALAEIGRKVMPGVDNFTEYTEAYSFSASMAFALIMLGKGGKITSEVDRRLLAKLTRCIVGTAPTMESYNALDTSVTAPGATLALGLMYLKTERQDVADILDIPTSTFALEHVRPDVLLLRTFARALIMWEDIAPSMAWIETQIPAFINHQNHKKTAQLELHTELAYINIVAGACLAIGLKHAGTAGEVAHNSLMTVYGILAKVAGTQSMAYEGSIRRTAARQALNIVTLALTVVMSGTGELNIMRRLRVSHSQEGAGVTYGTHMAMHMALGILFLGRGYYTLGSSNLAIAAMAISFFPRFLATPGDNKAYPQAFRHLWALAVEPRCLVARDVDTRETVYLPVRVKSSEGGQERFQSLISPTLIAPFESLLSIQVDSPRYWPITYDLTNPRDKAALVKTRTIYVKRKAGYLDYNSDPRGNRSMFIRTGTMTGLDLNYDLISPAAPPAVPAEEVLQLIQAHSGDPWLIALADRFGGECHFERAVRVVMLECVSLDKPGMIPIYMSLLLASRDDTVETIRQLIFLKKFYTSRFDRYYALPTRERQTPLIRGNFYSALLRRLTDTEVSSDAKEVYWRQGGWPSEDAGQLAVYMARNGVPPVQLLHAMKEHIGAEGVTIETRSKVRRVARAYMAELEAQWDVTPGEPGLEQFGWKAANIEEAILVWAGDGIS